MKNHSELAKKYRCTTRTIRAWKAQRAPLGDEQKMIVWLSVRRNLPPATAEWLASMKRAEKAVKSKAIAETATERGAVAAMRRLEETEALAYDALQRALASGDALEIKAAREGWLRVGDSLRRYDLLIAGSKRDEKESISRAEAVRILRLFAWSLRCGIGQTLQGAAVELAGIKEPSIIAGILKRATWDTILAAGAIIRAEQFPQWAADALAEDMENFIASATDRQKAITRCIVAFLESKV